ncbi:MAG: MBL fold metallo-hydrolase [Aquincola tertiaricarbonis]
MLHFTHHGAVRGVTGSCHRLTLPDGKAVLVDCGLFQGAETSPDGASASQLDIDFPLDKVRALVVTHVHIDHVGRIPYRLAAAFAVPSTAARPAPSCCRWCWKTRWRWALRATAA